MDTERLPKLITVSIFLFALALLSACGASATPAASPTSTAIALPSPTFTSQVATITPTLLPKPILPTPTVACENGLTFVNDLTLFDGAIVPPGSHLDKQWLVQNTGSCNWDERYRMRLISGEAMGAATEQALYPARSGTTATLRILFTAPAEAGEYVSEWQAFDYNGTPFGDSFFMKVIVQ